MKAGLLISLILYGAIFFVGCGDQNTNVSQDQDQRTTIYAPTDFEREDCRECFFKPDNLVETCLSAFECIDKEGNISEPAA